MRQKYSVFLISINTCKVMTCCVILTERDHIWYELNCIPVESWTVRIGSHGCYSICFINFVAELTIRMSNCIRKSKNRDYILCFLIVLSE